MVSFLGRLLLLVLIVALAAAAGILLVAEYRLPAMLFACGAAALFWVRDGILREEGFLEGRAALDRERSQTWFLNEAANARLKADE